MNYELAKELKDAGFPQTGLSGNFLSSCLNPTDQAYAPTLEELISACPAQIDGSGTIVIGSARGGSEWVATYFDFRSNRITSIVELTQSGTTPAEAVARLWLAVRKFFI